MAVIRLIVVEAIFLLQIFCGLLVRITRCLRHEYAAGVAERSMLLTCLSLRCRLRMVRHVDSSHVFVVPDVYDCFEFLNKSAI